MVKLFYTTYISVDLAHHEIFRAKVGRGGINVNIKATYQVEYSLSMFRVITVFDYRNTNNM